MAYYVGLDVSLKQTAICVVDGDCGVVWQGCADTHPEMILSVLARFFGLCFARGARTRPDQTAASGITRPTQSHLAGLSGVCGARR